MAVRISKAHSHASVGVAGKYKGDSSNKTTAREETMDPLVFFFIYIKLLKSSELLGYQDLHLGQMDLPPEPVIVSPYLESLVFSNGLFC